MAGIRCFFAVKINRTASFEFFIRRQEELKWGRVKWSQPGHLHVTLRFLGEMDVVQLDRLLLSLNEWNPGVCVFDFLIEGIGLFRNIHQPRVIWAGIREQNHFLALHQDLNELLLEYIGIDNPPEHYYPHLTLGRIKKVHKPNVLRQQIENNEHLAFGSFKAEEILLIESKISQEGATYITLGKKKLNPVTPDNS